MAFATKQIILVALSMVVGGAIAVFCLLNLFPEPPEGRQLMWDVHGFAEQNLRELGVGAGSPPTDSQLIAQAKDLVQFMYGDPARPGAKRTAHLIGRGSEEARISVSTDYGVVSSTLEFAFDSRSGSLRELRFVQTR